jgi:CRISPR/Cas system-associated protein Csm6
MTETTKIARTALTPAERAARRQRRAERRAKRITRLSQRLAKVAKDDPKRAEIEADLARLANVALSQAAYGQRKTA